MLPAPWTDILWRTSDWNQWMRLVLSQPLEGSRPARACQYHAYFASMMRKQLNISHVYVFVFVCDVLHRVPLDPMTNRASQWGHAFNLLLIVGELPPLFRSYCGSHMHDSKCKCVNKHLRSMMSQYWIIWELCVTQHHFDRTQKKSLIHGYFCPEPAAKMVSMLIVADIVDFSQPGGLSGRNSGSSCSTGLFPTYSG